MQSVGNIGIVSHELLLDRIFNVTSHSKVPKQRIRSGSSSHENQDSLNSLWGYGEEKKGHVEHGTVLSNQARLPKFALTIKFS